MVSVTALSVEPHGLVVHLGAQATATLSWRWIRDHGEDPESFDHATRQRRVFALEPAEPEPAIDASLASEAGNEVITFTWPVAPHETWISVDTVTRLVEPAPSVGRTLWHRAADVRVTSHDVDAVLGDDETLADWLRDLATYGYASLHGFEGGHGQVERLAGRIGYASPTIFGTTWDLASDLEVHDDTAYSQSFLAPHTDGTYSHLAPGLQMFCCTERDGTGGESIVVDGFAIAATLRADFPDDFEVLTTVSVPGHYIEPGIELRASRPAIRLDDAGTVVQMSMNNYDRSPMLLPEPAMGDFYRAYGRLHELANDRSRWQAIRLKAGDVLINDNWRVMHGRHAYTGARRFIGCYLNHEDLESRCRTLGIAALS